MSKNTPKNKIYNIQIAILAISGLMTSSFDCCSEHQLIFTKREETQEKEKTSTDDEEILEENNITPKHSSRRRMHKKNSKKKNPNNPISKKDGAPEDPNNPQAEHDENNVTKALRYNLKKSNTYNFNKNTIDNLTKNKTLFDILFTKNSQIAKNITEDQLNKICKSTDYADLCADLLNQNLAEPENLMKYIEIITSDQCKITMHDILDIKKSNTEFYKIIKYSFSKNSTKGIYNFYTAKEHKIKLWWHAHDPIKLDSFLILVKMFER